MKIVIRISYYTHYHSPFVIFNGYTPQRTKFNRVKRVRFESRRTDFLRIRLHSRSDWCIKFQCICAVTGANVKAGAAVSWKFSTCFHNYINWVTNTARRHVKCMLSAEYVLKQTPYNVPGNLRCTFALFM